MPSALDRSYSIDTATLPRFSQKFRPAVRDAEYPARSPSLLMPPLTVPSRPSKLVFVTKLTTPATASDPYTADLPPVTISIRSIRSVGIVLTSTVKLPGDAETWRRPFCSTSVLSTPSPRRSRKFTPAVPMKRVELAEL